VADSRFGSGRLLVVAFEGWNDAGEAASGAVRALKELLDLYPTLITSSTARRSPVMMTATAPWSGPE
jgi:hypothetical protein